MIIRCSECWCRITGYDAFLEHFKKSHKDVWEDIVRVEFTLGKPKIKALRMSTGKEVVIGVVLDESG